MKKIYFILFLFIFLISCNGDFSQPMLHKNEIESIDDMCDYFGGVKGYLIESHNTIYIVKSVVCNEDIIITPKNKREYNNEQL